MLSGCLVGAYWMLSDYLVLVERNKEQWKDCIDC